MEDDILRSAKAEEQRLEALIRENPVFQRLEAVRSIISLYSAPSPPSLEAQTGDQVRRRGKRTEFAGGGNSPGCGYIPPKKGETSSVWRNSSSLADDGSYGSRKKTVCGRGFVSLSF